MNKHKNISQKLLLWYRKNARDLPWRRTNDPYKIWISEIMLQQTTVNAVIPYYKCWMKEFPNVKKVAKARLQKVLNTWQGLGYYTRAKNIHKAAKLIVSEYQGVLPSSPEELKKLPGFGPYTVGAVSSIAFNIRYPIVDANVRRVIMRLLAIEGFADNAKDGTIISFLEKIMPRRNVGDFNQALMELGALICSNRNPQCLACPLLKHCKAYKKGNQELIPRKKVKSIKELDVAVAILRRKGKYFIQKRPSTGLLADLWEFPGGKIEKGETPLRALKREIREEINIDISHVEHLVNVKHYYTQFRVNLHAYLCQPEKSPQISRTRRWVSLNAIANFPMPSGSARIVERLNKKLDK